MDFDELKTVKCFSFLMYERHVVQSTGYEAKLSSQTAGFECQH